MNEFISALYDFAKRYTLFGNNYSQSLAIFCICLVAGAFVLIAVCSSEKACKKGCSALPVLYTACFLTDIALCLCECHFIGEKFTTLPAAYLFCFVKYIALIVLYAGICIYCSKKNKVSDGTFVKEKANATRVVHQINEEPAAARTLPECEPLSLRILDKMDNSRRESEPPVDINVSYVRSLIAALCDRNITDEERELCRDLDLKLRMPLPKDNAGVRAMNDALQILVKKLSAYGVEP